MERSLSSNADWGPSEYSSCYWNATSQPKSEKYGFMQLLHTAFEFQMFTYHLPRLQDFVRVRRIAVTPHHWPMSFPVHVSIAMSVFTSSGQCWSNNPFSEDRFRTLEVGIWPLDPYTAELIDTHEHAFYCWLCLKSLISNSLWCTEPPCLLLVNRDVASLPPPGISLVSSCSQRS